MPLGGGPQCPVCQKTVYFNEERRALGKIFHVTCFKCESCKKSLDSTNSSEHENLMYCSACHRKLFGPKGYGFAGGAAGLSTTSAQRGGVSIGLGGTGEPGDPSDPENCPTCAKRVYFAEQVLALQRKWHKLCFKCTTCRKSLDSTSSTEHDMQPYCKACYAKNFGPSGYGFAGGAAGLATTNGKSVSNGRTNGTSNVTNGVNRDDPENCPRCGKRVYFAEQLLSLNRKWHKFCFKCVACSKTVDSTSAADHGGELYCRPCHSRNFGIKGVGFGIGAGTLSTT